MVQVDMIKDLQRKEMGPIEIAERLGLDRKTVSKYMKIEDYNPKQPIKKCYESKLDQWKPIIRIGCQDDFLRPGCIPGEWSGFNLL